MKRLISLFLLLAVSTAMPMQSQFVDWAKATAPVFKQGLLAARYDAKQLASVACSTVSTNVGNLVSSAYTLSPEQIVNLSRQGLQVLQKFVTENPHTAYAITAAAFFSSVLGIAIMKDLSNTKEAEWPKTTKTTAGVFGLMQALSLAFLVYTLVNNY